MNHLFANITRYTDFLPIIIFLFPLKGKADKGLWVIFFYCLFVALNDNFLLKALPVDNLQYLYTAFTMFELLAFTFFLWYNTKSRLFKKVVAFASIAFIIFIGVYSTNASFKKIDSMPIGVETILVICFSVFYLYEQVNKNLNMESDRMVYNTPEFWVIIGFLIYLAGSFFIYIYANHVPIAALKQFWFVTYIFAILKNIFIAIAFLVQIKTPKIRRPEAYQPYLN